MKFAFARDAVKDLRPLRGAYASLTASSLRLSFYYRGSRCCPFSINFRLTHVWQHVLPMSGNHAVPGGDYAIRNSTLTLHPIRRSRAPSSLRAGGRMDP
jgi:hypothetical protein